MAGTEGCSFQVFARRYVHIAGGVRQWWSELISVPGIALIAEIPKSVSGKILKRKLRELEEQTRVVCKL